MRTIMRLLRKIGYISQRRYERYEYEQFMQKYNKVKNGKGRMANTGQDI